MNGDDANVPLTVSINDILEKSRRYSDDHKELIQYSIRNTFVTTKQYYIAYIRICLAPLILGCDTALSVEEYKMVRFTEVTKEAIDELVGNLIRHCNVYLDRQGYRLERMIRDRDNTFMIALVHDISIYDHENIGTKFTPVELDLIFRWMDALFDEPDGMTEERALKIAKKVQIDEERSETILERLVSNYLIEKFDNKFFITARGMLECHPSIVHSIPLILCPHCYRMVVMTQLASKEGELIIDEPHKNCPSKSCEENMQVTCVPSTLRICGTPNVHDKGIRNEIGSESESNVDHPLLLAAEDEEAMATEKWDDGEEGTYVPTPLERILLKEKNLM